MVRLTGRYFAMFISGFVGLFALATYPVMIQPMLNPEPYKKNRERAYGKAGPPLG
ncbi:uncharacterized protein LOC112694999 [Athalia rosae]|uniref:uncharacterized protein LOC112694999 n=1 Tax=Athalia rosae TaxID=37344 RepID=UPI00203404FA|nr:uncharacterized protein LOC112694999 [Athalia rosae]